MYRVRKVRPLSKEALEALPTHRVMAYRSKLLALEESPELSDLEPGELELLEPGFLYFKSDPEWRRTHGDLTAVLGGRPHVE